MKKLIFLFFLAHYSALQAGDVLPQSITENNTEFERCDAFTVRYGFVIKVVEIAWYAPVCNGLPLLKSANKILRFHYFKDVKAEFFRQSAEEYFLLNLDTKAQQQALIEPLKNFNDGYTDIQSGEYFQLVLANDTHLSLYRNNNLLAFTDNVDLAKKYFNIWFGKDPVIEKLKSAFH